MIIYLSQVDMWSNDFIILFHTDSQLAQWRESKKIYKSKPTGTIEQKEKQVKKIQPLTKKKKKKNTKAGRGTDQSI